MRTYCKNVDILDMDLIKRGIWDALSGKLNRDNYASYIATFGVHTGKQVKRLAKDLKYGVIDSGAFHKEFEKDVDLVAAEVHRQFSNKKLELGEVRYEERFDKGTRKWRMLGIETPIHQIIEHIAVLALDELWKKKLCYHQYSSISGKGQAKGSRAIRKWAKQGTIQYFVKGDIRKCFDNIGHEDVMKLLRRDIGKNRDLLWLIEELLKYHNSPTAKPGRGLLVGSWLSSMLCNYMLSYAYRHVIELCRMRRGKRNHYVRHALFFMDDMLLTATNRKDLKSGIRELSAFLNERFSLEIKPNWHVKDFSKEPITMMGFTVFFNGDIKIRRQNFLNIRRSYITIDSGKFDIKDCRTCSAYHGNFKGTQTQKVWDLPDGRRINIPVLQKKASHFQSDFERKRRLEYAESCKLRRNAAADNNRIQGQPEGCVVTHERRGSHRRRRKQDVRL